MFNILYVTSFKQPTKSVAENILFEKKLYDVNGY